MGTCGNKEKQSHKNNDKIVERIDNNKIAKP